MEFFSRWREQLPHARTYVVACRDCVKTDIAYVSGARAAELCPVTIGDIHREHGRWGRFAVIARKGTVHGPGLGKSGWGVERTFARAHRFKRLRIRYEIRADPHLTLLQLACIIICWGRLRTSF